jgi:Uma2 family endonuclease
MHPAGDRRALCVTLLNDLLAVLSAQGEVSVSPQNPVHLDDFSEPRADLAVVQRRQAGLGTGNPTSDDIYFLIEVADSYLEHDQQSKMPLYARSGVPEAWLVDLTRNVLEVRRDPAPDGYRSVQRLRHGDRISPQAFPDFEIAVESILP